MFLLSELFQNYALNIKLSTPFKMADMQITCRYHPGAFLIEDSHAGDTICSECGLVCGDRILDVSKEWNTKQSSLKSYPVEDSKHVYLGGDVPPDVPNNKSRNQTRIVYQALKMTARNISKIAEKINVTKAVVDQAIHLFSTIHDKEFLKGKTKISIAVACLYFTCRQECMPRTFREICAVSKTYKKEEIGKVVKLLIQKKEFLPH